MNINGTKITVTKGSLTNALFNCSTLEAFGSFTKAEARQAARVMLAGPELLAALKGIIDQACVNGCPEFNHADGEGYCVVHTAECAAARAAIAKAEGGVL